MTLDARVDTFVIGVGRVLKGQAAAAEHIDRSIDVVCAEGDVLNAFAVILPQILLDLALVVLRLVDGDADLAARTGHRAREEARLFALDVEVADLAEVEQPLVEAFPNVHVATLHVVREVINARETWVLRGRRGNRPEVDVINRAIAVSVDEVDERAADAFDAGDVELHRARAL